MMNWLNPVYVVLLAVLSAAAAVVIMIAARRVIGASAHARRRVVEPPNSQFTSQRVRDAEALTRWRNVTLDEIHEINRGEVERLLARAAATGVGSLAPAERVFLDQFAPSAPTADPPATPPLSAGIGSAAEARRAGT